MSPDRVDPIRPTADGHAAWVCHYAEPGYSIRHALRPFGDDGGLLLTSTLRNEGAHAQAPAAVLCHAGSWLEGPASLDRVYRHTRAMDGFSGLDVAPARFESSGCCGFTDASGELAAVFGVSNYGAFLGDIQGERAADGRGWRLTVGCQTEGLLVPPGGEGDAAAARADRGPQPGRRAGWLRGPRRGGHARPAPALPRR